VVADADAVRQHGIAAAVDGKDHAVEAEAEVDVHADEDAGTNSDDRAAGLSVCLVLPNTEEAESPHPAAPATAGQPRRTGPGDSSAHSTVE
jgi:hypothetical protein